MTIPSRERIGARLRARRLQFGMTQEDVADRLAVDRSLVSRMETGGTEIDVVRFWEWCEMLGLSVKVETK